MTLKIGNVSWTNSNENTTETKKFNGVIQAQDLNINNQNDTLLQKKKQAGQDAMSLVKEVFERQSADDDEIDASHEDIEAQKSAKLDLVNQMKDATEAKEGLADKYDLTDEELEEINDVSSGNGDIESLSSNQREYMEESASYDSAISNYQQQIKDCDYKMSEDRGTIKGIKDARLKEHDMVDANKEADAINEAASKEYVSGLVKDAVDKANDKDEEAQKAAEEKKEEKEEVEEKKEERKAEKEDQENRTDDLRSDDISASENTSASDIDNTMSQIRKAVNDIATKQNLTEDDLKGIQVDEII